MRVERSAFGQIVYEQILSRETGSIPAHYRRGTTDYGKQPVAPVNNVRKLVGLPIELDPKLNDSWVSRAIVFPEESSER
jgi:hypothetical protein